MLRGDSDKQAIGEFDHGLQKLYLEFSKERGLSWQEISQAIKGREFFRAGHILRALECESPCVLLIDELDKVDQATEAILLEPLAEFQISRSEIGTIKAKSVPFIVITSNEERHLGDPIRRRCLYVRVEHPTPEREAEIIASRTPEESPEFHREIAGIGLAFRNYSLEKPPSVSEILDLVAAVRIFERDRVTEDLHDVFLSILANTEKDRRHLLIREGFESLLIDARRYAQRMAQDGAAVV